MEPTISPEEKISRHFTYREALSLPRLGRMAGECDGLNESVVENLKTLFDKLDSVRDFIGHPIVVHCAYRSAVYNQEVGGAKDSAHMAKEPGVAAVDFHVEGMSCHDAQMKFLPMLEHWNMRMENNGSDPTWIHLDIGRAGHRYFKP